MTAWAIILAFYGEQPYRRGAEIMDVPEGTAKGWIAPPLPDWSGG